MVMTNRVTSKDPDGKPILRRADTHHTLNISIAIILIGLLAVIKLELFPTPPYCNPAEEGIFVPNATTDCAITFLLSSNAYFPCLAVVLHSLELVHTNIDIVVLTTPNIHAEAIEALKLFDVHNVRTTAISNPNPEVRLKHLTDNFTKLRAWQLAGYRKIIYSDIDFLYTQNSDDLCHLPGKVYAGRNWNTTAGDWVDPNFFNAGFMIITPSTETFCDMYQASSHTETKSGGDQQFQNTYWKGRWDEIQYDADGANANIYARLNERWDPDEVRSIHYTKKTNPCNHKNVSEIKKLWKEWEKKGIPQADIERLDPMVAWYRTYLSLLELHPQLEEVFELCEFMTGNSDTGTAFSPVRRKRLRDRLGFA